MSAPTRGAPVGAIHDEPSGLDAIAGAFETQRAASVAARAKRRLTVGAAGAGLAIILLLAAVFGPASGVPFPVVLFAIGALIIGGYVWQDAPVRRYARLVKNTAFEAALASIGRGWRFAPSGGFSLDDLKRFRILPGYDTAKQEDYLSGPYRGLPVEIAELTLTERRGTGKNRRTVTTFDGLVVRIGLPRAHEAHTIVLRRMGHPGLFTSFERVRLEDPDFESVFNVYSTDQIAARTLLTPSFMERLRLLSDDMRRLGRRSDGRLTAAAVGDQLLILVPCTTDLFEVRNAARPGHLRADLERLLVEVRDVLAIADRLRLQAD